MAFVKYPASITAAVGASELAAASARALQNNTGDITFRSLGRLFNNLELMELKWRIAVADAQAANNMQAVNSFLASIGGPTAAVLNSQLGDLKTAKNAFGDALQTYLQNQPASILVSVPTLTDVDGNKYRELQFGSHISDPEAQTLRNAQVVANLVAAFDALGV